LLGTSYSDDYRFRDEAPDSFTYAVAKTLDEHQELFRMYGDPWYYDTRMVADSKVIPSAPATTGNALI